MTDELTIPEEEISDYIFLIREAKVILDTHLALLYEVETRNLKQQVKRNLKRFPEDFMFELTDEEIEGLITANIIPNKRVLGGARPMAFSEQGVAMLSSVIRSDKAIEVNIAIMRTFVHLRRFLETYKDLEMKIDRLEKQYDEQFTVVFEVIKKLVHQEEQPREKIGFKTKKKD